MSDIELEVEYSDFNKRNNKPDYLLRAIRIDKGLMSLTLTKKAEIKGVFGRGYFSDDQDEFLKRG